MLQNKKYTKNLNSNNVHDENLDENIKVVDDSFKRIIPLIDKAISNLLTHNDLKLERYHGAIHTLNESMKYATSSGMRMRPYLLITIISMLRNNDIENWIDKYDTLNIAAAIEMIHNYSLIHDDLPDLDNDDYRRGQLSCHKKFGTANAILAGDALLTEAFYVLSSNMFKHIDINQRINIINIIAYHSGSNGMVFGQSIDMLCKLNQDIDGINCNELNKILLKKTTGLFQMTCETAAIICQLDKNKSNHLFHHLSEYGRVFGELYQLIDDINDNEQNTSDHKQNASSINKMVSQLNNILSHFNDSIYKTILITLPAYIQYRRVV